MTRDHLTWRPPTKHEHFDLTFKERFKHLRTLEHRRTTVITALLALAAVLILSTAQQDCLT